MFGEYAIYLDEKVVGFVCNDQLFVKPTKAGRAYIGDVTETPAYPGSKMYFLISTDQWEDRDWLTELLLQTAAELPLPKPKRKQRK
jgi:TfoX/Sxy family transcriptional regulator of competence genes